MILLVKPEQGYPNLDLYIVHLGNDQNVCFSQEVRALHTQLLLVPSASVTQ
eukprot:UN19543